MHLKIEKTNTNCIKREQRRKFDMIWSKEETLSRAEMEALQLERLQETVNRVYEKVPYYREKMQEMEPELLPASRSQQTWILFTIQSSHCCVTSAKSLLSSHL